LEHNEITWRPVKVREVRNEDSWIEAIIIDVNTIMLGTYFELEYIGLNKNNNFVNQTTVIERDPGVSGFETEEELINNRVKLLKSFSSNWKRVTVKHSFKNKFSMGDKILYRELLDNENINEHNLEKYF